MSLIDIHAKIQGALKDPKCEELCDLFKQLTAHRAVFSREPELFQNTLNLIFKFADAHQEKEYKKLISILSHHSLLRDISKLKMTNQRRDSVQVFRLYQMFGISFDTEQEVVQEEDTTSPLSEEQALSLSPEYAHNYEKVLNYIERTDSAVAQGHLSLQFLEQSVELQSKQHNLGLISFLLRLFHNNKDLLNYQLPGKKQKQFDERWLDVMQKLSRFQNTAQKPFIIHYIQTKQEQMSGYMLSDFSKLYQFTESYQDTEEPLYRGTSIELALDVDYKSFTQQSIVQICTQLHQQISNPTAEQNMQLAITIIRASGIDDAKKLIEKGNTKMYKTILVECALQQLKQKQFGRCIEFLGRVCADYKYEQNTYKDYFNITEYDRNLKAIMAICCIGCQNQIQESFVDDFIFEVQNDNTMITELIKSIVNGDAKEQAEKFKWDLLTEAVTWLVQEREKAALGSLIDL